MIAMMPSRRRIGRAVVLTTDDARDLSAPRLPAGADVGWAVSELFEAAWIAAGGNPAEFHRSPRGLSDDRTR
jgi:hypothetical protein